MDSTCFETGVKNVPVLNISWMSKNIETSGIHHKVLEEIDALKDRSARSTLLQHVEKIRSVFTYVDVLNIQTVQFMETRTARMYSKIMTEDFISVLLTGHNVRY